VTEKIFGFDVFLIPVSNKTLVNGEVITRV
jgi:hypothetical protein